MKYRIGIHNQIVEPNRSFNTVVYFDEQNEWAYSSNQMESYEYYKSTDSADLRDKSKNFKMEEKFRTQFSYPDNVKTIIHYES